LYIERVAIRKVITDIEVSTRTLIFVIVFTAENIPSLIISAIYVKGLM
jgi:hypothetical protein